MGFRAGPGHYLQVGARVLVMDRKGVLKAHYATFLAKITLSMQVESYADGSASISGLIGGCVIYPCRLSSEKAHMQLALFGPTQSGCDATEVSSKM